MQAQTPISRYNVLFIAVRNTALEFDKHCPHPSGIEATAGVRLERRKRSGPRNYEYVLIIIAFANSYFLGFKSVRFSFVHHQRLVAACTELRSSKLIMTYSQRTNFSAFLRIKDIGTGTFSFSLEEKRTLSHIVKPVRFPSIRSFTSFSYAC